MRNSKFTTALVLVWACVAAANPQPAADTAVHMIFVVRHAERAEDASRANPMPGPADPILSPAGVDRARSLAALLRSAGVKRIFTTEFKRTKQTAGPPGVVAGVTLTIVPAEETGALVRRVLEGGAAAGPTLIVGHSNTIPAILEGLGVAEDISIPDEEYDNLFIVARPPSERATLVRLRY